VAGAPADAPPDAGGVLERTLAAASSPGTNRRGDVLGGAWILLLDDLDLGRVACLGDPGERTLRMLARRSRAVTVVCGAERARRRIAAAGLRNVTAIGPGAAAVLDAVDVAVVANSRWARRATHDPALGAVLARAGAVFDSGGVPPAGRAAQRLWLGVRDGEVESAAAYDDDAAVAFLRRPPAQATPGRMAVRERVRAARRSLRDREQEALLSGPQQPVPRYVRALAEAAGEPVDGFRVALSAPSDYPSRKAVMALFAPGATSPRYIVKLTRDPAFNDRLENEGRALRALAVAGIGDAATVPRAVFAGRPAGLALLGQTAIAGVPFRHRTTFAPDCPAARAGAGWLLELGERTAEPIVSGGPRVAHALRALLERYVALYRPGAAEHAALFRHVDAVAASAEPFPLVFQHGDPGTWNLLVAADGRPAFLDWEAAEPGGLPLWDLFYFARSAGIGVGRAAGARRSLDAFAGQMLADGVFARLVADDVARHCGSIDLDPALVAPLFFTCWMHRAVKEAARLPQGRLGRGRYVTLLRLCLARADAPGLARILGARGA
jgi:Phosphotransferase enzyme family